MKAPFPYAGGKSRVAAEVWSALGQPAHYIEPFFGSGSVLLARPGYDPAAHTETICDADGHVCNVWRALKADPDAVAEWCDWPVNHADLIARKKRLNLETAGLLERLCADEDYYEPKLAGYWIWAASCSIGHGLICPNAVPHVGVAGKGVHAKGQIPHVGHAGRGVHAKSASIYEWFAELSARLRRVRVVCGDWTRVCGGNWQAKIGTVGIFFDPPYGEATGRYMRIYSTDCGEVADRVRAWCAERGPNKSYRIVLAGYYEEHEELLSAGWRVHRWSARGGYGNTARDGESNGQRNRHREALFFSPHCLQQQGTLFANERMLQVGV